MFLKLVVTCSYCAHFNFKTHFPPSNYRKVPLSSSLEGRLHPRSFVPCGEVRVGGACGLGFPTTQGFLFVSGVS